MTVYWCVVHNIGEARPAGTGYICELRSHHPDEHPDACRIVEAVLEVSS